MLAVEINFINKLGRGIHFALFGDCAEQVTEHKSPAMFID